MVEQVFGINISSMDSTEENECGYLKKADLKCIGGADLHGKSNIAVHGERNGVEELGGVGYEGEEGNAEEFLVDVHTF